jgi:hypothetical protein
MTRWIVFAATTSATRPVVIAPGERALGAVLLGLSGVVIVFVTARNTVARRHWIASRVKWFVLRFALLFAAYLFVLREMVLVGFRGWWVQYLAMALCSPLMGPMPPLKRSRNIPVRIRRAVIQRYKERTGSFDPTVEELDHVVPFSKGGGHTEDNLWIIPRKANRAKGDKMPSLEDWLRFTFRRYHRPRTGSERE